MDYFSLLQPAIALTTKYIIGNDLARSFLDKVMYMPTAPVYIISGSVGLLLCLAYCVYYREFNNIRNKTINYLYSLLEVVISVILIFLIYLSYNGIILFVFCDCMYHLKKGLKYQVLFYPKIAPNQLHQVLYIYWQIMKQLHIFILQLIQKNISQSMMLA